ncbi:MAG: hypothetical protein K2M50_07470 [Treponemataceae bacterium]|nr:hypothetical protein [Treponemataceae bacterium]
MIKFYDEWADFSFLVFIKMNDERNQVIKTLSNIDLPCHVNLCDYYETQAAKEMTKKITVIQPWHNLDSLMIKENNLLAD